MSNQELKSLIKILRSTGVVSYKAQGVEILLDPNFVATTKQKTFKSQRGDLQSQIDSITPKITEEDWLLAGVSADESEVM